MELEDAEYYLKAMNCPMHNLIFRSRGRSYRELPLRLFEFGTVYRYEKSGVVHGLTRVRGLTQDDSHIYCTPEQAPGEIRHLLNFVLGLLRDFGLDDFYLELSTRDDPNGQVHRLRRGVGGRDRGAARTAARSPASSSCPTRAAPRSTARRSPCRPATRSAAPGRCRPSSTTSTSPSRFGLEYQAADGTRQQPVMIHSAKFGSIERFFGVLTEHYAGAFPAWLAPVQVVGIPVADEQVPLPARRRATAARRRASGSRSTTPTTGCRRRSAPRSSRRCRSCCIAGATDAEAGAVSFRYRDGSQRNGVPVDEAVAADRATGSPPGRNVDATAADGRRAGAGSSRRTRPDAGRPATDGAGEPDGFERLWTPHRMAYIKGEGKPTGAERRLPVLPDPDAARRGRR